MPLLAVLTLMLNIKLKSVPEQIKVHPYIHTYNMHLITSNLISFQKYNKI